MNFEVSVKNNQLAPAREKHHLPLCDIHAKACDTVKWEWRRAGTESTRLLILETVLALDALEDRLHP
jgi:hypothetical protein